jgi:hypothetical protein
MLAELEEVVEYKLAPERRSTIRDMWWKRLQVLYYSPIPQVSASDPSPVCLYTQSYESCFVFFIKRYKGLPVFLRSLQSLRTKIFLPYFGCLFSLSWTINFSIVSVNPCGSGSETQTGLPDYCYTRFFLKTKKILYPILDAFLAFLDPGPSV